MSGSWHKKSWTPQTPQRTRATKPQGGKGKQDKNAFPPYDAGFGSGAASSSAPPSLSTEESLKKAMQVLLESNQMCIPEQINFMLSDSGMGEIRSEQQQLNKRKKLIQKLERLRKAKATKIQLLAKYKDDMTKALKAEGEKFEKRTRRTRDSHQGNSTYHRQVEQWHRGRRTRKEPYST